MLGFGSAFEKLSQNIPFNFQWSETIRKRAIRYLLQRYVGQFLLETLSLDQLSVDLSNGTGIIKDLSLDICSLNEVAEQLNLPFKFIDGYIGEILVNIPWRNLYNENCFVGISGLKLILHPKQRDGEVSLVDSMIDSMSTSMQIAQECLSQVNLPENNLDKETSEKENETGSAIDGIEIFAKIIDTILNKIKVRFTDSVIRLEYVPKLSSSGVALDIKIDKIDYFDEAGFEKEQVRVDVDKNALESAAFTSKKFLIEGVSLYTSEFSISKKSDEPESFQTKFYRSLDDLTEEEHYDSNNISLNTENSSHNSSIDSSSLPVTSILIAKLSNRQEIKLKLRKNDTVSGPKVNFEAKFGALIAFLSPRQVHILMELAEGISSPESIDYNREVLDNKSGVNCHQKPMNQQDFKKIERELMQNITPPQPVSSHSLGHHEGWSSPPEICDDEFHPVYSGRVGGAQGRSNPMTSSTLTDMSDLECSFSSTKSVATTVISSNNKKSSGNDVLTNFKIRMNSLCITILHEDILISSTVFDEIVTNSSMNEMMRTSDDFFSSVGISFNKEHCYEAYMDLKNKVEGACSLSHLRLIATSIVADGKETNRSNKWDLKTSITAGPCEVLECINDCLTEDTPKMSYNKLLTFKERNSSDKQFQSLLKPKIQVEINLSQNITTTGRSRRMSIPQSDIKINLDECTLEVDFSLVDRINALLNKPVLIPKDEMHLSPDNLPPSHLDNQAFFKEIMDEAPKPESKTKLTVKCSGLTLKLYFPIPDLRPFSDMDRVPWWKRNVRDDILITHCEDFYLGACFSPSCADSFEILSNDVHIQFQEKKDVLPVSLLRASASKGIEKGFNPVRIYVQSFASKLDFDLEDDPTSEHENIMTKSMMGFLEEELTAAANIFSKRKVASQHRDNLTELTVPSEGEEISRFINDTLKNVQFEVDVSLSDVQLILPSKHIYEVVYNRLVSDLLLWMPSAPVTCKLVRNSLSSAIDDLSIGTTLIQDKYFRSLSEFKSFDSSKNVELRREDDIGYTSIYDQNYVSPKPGSEKTPNGQTLIGLQIKLRNAIGSIHTPYRDVENKIVSGKYGDVTFKFDKGFIFIASGYKGSRDSCHGCIAINEVEVYHKANNSGSSTCIYLDPEFPLSPRKLDAVLYPSDEINRMGGGNNTIDESKDSVSICFKMDYDIVKNENVFELAGGLFGLTLRHFMVGPTETWVSQLGDMFNVEDYPIKGYSLPDVITELNFNFEYCAFDYRPLHLPLKCYMTIDSLAISSNVTVKGNSSVLLFFIEDAGLFLSQNLAFKNVNLKENYVCVADLGVFELCIKLDESSNIPVRELLFSNNIIHLRTCSDSFKALMEMIIYLANEGDLIQEPDHHKIKDKTVVLEPSHVEEASHSPLEENATICHKFMENLMQEAMVESRLPDKMSSVKIQEDSEDDTFFFPDENTKGRKVSHGSTKKFHELDTEMALREAQEELSSEILDDNKPGTDDEFCFLDEVPGTGIQSLTGKPKVKYLRPEIIVIKDDHFNPSNNYSLNTPKHFPKPHTQYNLQELSIIWHMYGGKDFEEEKDLRNDRNGNHKVQLNTNTSPFNSPPPSVKFKEVQCVSFVNDASIASERSSSVSFNKPPASKSSKPNANVKWFTIGGPNRCHDTLMEIQLSKIRFKYDLYPEKCSLVSRHVLAVNDIEIRDRLASSKINKFLYQYSSENCPKQASSNMIQVKAITKRSDPSVSSSETSLNISVRPIRLNIDQDALIFLSNYFENVAISEKEVEFGEEERPSNSFSHAPVLTLNHDYDRFKEERIDELLVREERVDVVDKDSPIYFRNVVFSPDVPIKIDYHGKHVDINSQYGALAGLIIGLGQLDHSEITLKRVEFKSGVLGVSKLANSLTNEWIYDIRKNQLPSILGGVGPMHSFVKLFSGFKDLFWLPVEQYNKDGRVLRGLQKGTSAFTSSSAYAVLDLTGRFVGCIQATAETMYDMVSSGPSVRNKSYKKRKGQPKDIREGVTAAFGLVRNGLGDTANTLMKVASDEHSHKGVSGAVGGVLRQIPPSVVQPIIIASEATCTFIGGMTNQLVPDARREAAEKWKA